MWESAHIVLHTARRYGRYTYELCGLTDGDWGYKGKPKRCKVWWMGVRTQRRGSGTKKLDGWVDLSVDVDVAAGMNCIHTACRYLD